ncbi:hypothetical protein TELCIR_11482 [Teladorsagia circumcincta]|uniref:Uncharacterized protein n=1 Tax=Teladorsagia circumcincta TaxID=45464 RepID=A0A2G9U9C2_TELCI|nr:hypothetical protein TELCIR_11482 [Teladorsagia circumcincta]
MIKVYQSFKIKIFTARKLRMNRPFINPELTLPSLISGIIYSVATYCFFLANQHLDQTIAYPILSKAPGVVVSLWAVFLFEEIKVGANCISPCLHSFTEAFSRLH